MILNRVAPRSVSFIFWIFSFSTVASIKTILLLFIKQVLWLHVEPYQQTIKIIRISPSIPNGQAAEGIRKLSHVSRSNDLGADEAALSQRFKRELLSWHLDEIRGEYIPLARVQQVSRC